MKITSFVLKKAGTPKPFHSISVEVNCALGEGEDPEKEFDAADSWLNERLLKMFRSFPRWPGSAVERGVPQEAASAPAQPKPPAPRPQAPKPQAPAPAPKPEPARNLTAKAPPTRERPTTSVREKAMRVMRRFQDKISAMDPAERAKFIPTLGFRIIDEVYSWPEAKIDELAKKLA